MAAYIHTFTSDDWGNRYSSALNMLRQSLFHCEEVALAWYKFTYGKSSAELATEPQLSPWTADDITNVSAVMGAILELQGVLEGTQTVPTVKNYLDQLRFFE